MCGSSVLGAGGQAVFSWANLPMELIKSSVEYLGGELSTLLPNNWFRSLLINGILD